jgi:predicted MFS family arabinose efflux permease
MEKKTKVVLNPKQILLLAALGFAQCMIFLLPYMQYTFYKPMMSALHCTNAQLGFLITIYGVFEVCSFLPGGWIADKFPIRKIITLSLVLVALSCFVAAIFVNYIVYIAIWIFVGIVANLIFWSATMKAVRLIGKPEQQGKAYGVFYLVNSGLSYLLPGVALAMLAAIGAATLLGFQSVLVLFGALAVLAAIIIWVTLGSQTIAAQVTSQEEKVSIKEMLKVLKRKEVWMIAIIAFCCYSLSSLVTYFVPYFTDVMKISVASAGAIYVITGPFAAFFGLITGTISDFFHSTIKVIVGVMVIVLAVLCLLLVFTGKLPFASAVAIDCTLTLAIGGCYQIMFSMVEETGMDRKVAGSCIGVASIIAYLPDIFLYTMFGNWLDKFGNSGYSMIFKYGIAVSSVAIIGGIILLASIRSAKKKKALLEAKTVKA